MSKNKTLSGAAQQKCAELNISEEEALKFPGSGKNGSVTRIDVVRNHAAKPTDQHSEKKVVIHKAVQKLIEEHELDASTITGTGKNDAITKDDVLAKIEELDAGDSEE